jgi:cytoskeletal protein RodZ
MSQKLGLGEFLREARVKAGLSLDQLSTRTRIRVENLGALEREELESLPADAYVRGFVKIVCRELRLSPDEGLALYSKLRSNTILPDEITWSEESTVTEPGALEKALQDPDRVMDYAKRARRWAIPLAAVVILAVLTLVIRGGKILAEEDDGAVAMRSTPKRTETPKPSPLQADAGSSNAGSSVVESPQMPPASKNVSGSDGVVPKPAETAPMIQESETKPESEMPAAPESKTAARNESVESAESTAPNDESVSEEFAGTSGSEPVAIDTTVSSAPPPVPGEPIMLEIIAVRDAEVTLILDGVGLPRKRSLIAGVRKSWKADSLFVLTVSDGGAVLLKLDDAYLGSPGMDGEAVTNLTVRK